MVVYKDIENMLNIGIPLAYRAFREYRDKPLPPPPFMVYRVRETARGSDDRVLYKRLHVTVELYTVDKSPELEDRLEAAIIKYEYEKNGDYLEDERVNVVSYEFYIYKKV